MEDAPDNAGLQPVLCWIAGMVCLIEFSGIKKSSVQEDLLRAHQDCTAQYVKLEINASAKPSFRSLSFVVAHGGLLIALTPIQGDVEPYCETIQLLPRLGPCLL
jgi:hypothetical protein